MASFRTQTTFTSELAWNGRVRAIGLHMAVELELLVIVNAEIGSQNFPILAAIEACTTALTGTTRVWAFGLHVAIRKTCQ